MGVLKSEIVGIRMPAALQSMGVSEHEVRMHYQVIAIIKSQPHSLQTSAKRSEGVGNV